MAHDQCEDFWNFWIWKQENWASFLKNLLYSIYYDIPDYDLILKADTHRTRFGNAARFFIFQKQINLSTIENFDGYKK